MLMLLLIAVAVFPAVQLPVNADDSNLIELPHSYFSGAEIDPPFLFEGQLGYNFCYDSYPTAEVSEYVKHLNACGLEAGATTKLLNGTQTCSLNYQGQLCVKLNYRASDKVLAVYLFQGNLEKLGFQIAAEELQPVVAATDGPWNVEQFFGTASVVEKEETRTHHSFICNGYPASQIEDYCAVLETFGLKQGIVFGMFGPGKTRKYTLNGELGVQISWVEREQRLEVYIYDDAFEEMKAAVDATTSATGSQNTDSVDTQAGAVSTEPEGMCKVCGLDLGTYDGYCYYCHPDFLFACLSCGYEQPYHRPENGLCEECAAALGSVDGVTGATG